MSQKNIGLKMFLIVSLLALAFATRWQWVASADINPYAGATRLSESQEEIGGQRVRKQSFATDDDINKVSAFYSAELKRTGWSEITTKFSPDFSSLNLDAFRTATLSKATIQLTSSPGKKGTLIELLISTDPNGGTNHQH